MEQTSPIVVGYDGSPDADLALAWAAGSATARGCDLRAVIVVSAMDPVFGDLREHSEQDAADWSKRAAERLVGLDVVHEVVVRHGPTVPTLLAASEGAQMLVVGSRGHGLFTGAFSGSVSQHVARHAPCPVVVVRAAQSPASLRVVVGLDGSPESERALRFACEQVRDRPGQTVVAVHGYRAYVTAKGNLEDLFSPATALRIAAAERNLEEWVAAVAADYPSVDIDTEAIAVPPARLLADCSEMASMVVVGSRGRDAFAELLLGSVSQQVLHQAHCPVAVVR